MKYFITAFKNDPLRVVSNIIFLIISCTLVASLLVQLTDSFYIKILFAVFSIGLDIFRQYIVSLAKVRTVERNPTAIFLWLAYGAHVIVVIVASASFSLSAIGANDTKIEAMETRSMVHAQNIGILTNQIAVLQDQEKKITNYGWEIRAIEKRINALNDKLKSELSSYTEATKTPVNTSKDGFNAIGKLIHVNGNILKVIMLIILSAILELSLVMTSWKIPAGTTYKKDPAHHIPSASENMSLRNFIITNKDNFIKYISAMVDINTKKLKGNVATCEIAGIPERDGKNIRQCLENLKTVNNVPLIKTSQGGAVYNFAPSELIKMIESIN